MFEVHGTMPGMICAARVILSAIHGLDEDGIEYRMDLEGGITGPVSVVAVPGNGVAAYDERRMKVKEWDNNGKVIYGRTGMAFYSARFGPLK